MEAAFDASDFDVDMTRQKGSWVDAKGVKVLIYQAVYLQAAVVPVAQPYAAALL